VLFHYIKKETLSMNMQVFYKQLFSDKAPTAHQRLLASLTRVNHAQITDATSELTWLLWSAESEAASA
jgi:hypothetical protein